MIFTLLNPFPSSIVRKAMPIGPSVDTGIVQVGYVGLLFSGSFFKLHQIRISPFPNATHLYANSINRYAFTLKSLNTLEQVVSHCGISETGLNMEQETRLTNSYV